LHSQRFLTKINYVIQCRSPTLETYMTISIALFVLLFARPFGVGTPERDSYISHLVKGDELYHSFDNQGALTEYKKAYDIAPDSFATLKRMISIYGDMGRLRLHKDTSSESCYRQALVYADTLVARFPGRAESHFWLALSQGSLIPFVGTKEKIHIAHSVQEEAKRAIEIDSDFALAYVVLGIFQREASKISWFERLIANVVFGADFSGSLEASESYLRKSVTLDPSNSYGYFELYWTYKAMKNPDKAVLSLKKLMAIPPTNAREQLQMDEAKRQLALVDGNP